MNTMTVFTEKDWTGFSRKRSCRSIEEISQHSLALFIVPLFSWMNHINSEEDYKTTDLQRLV